MKDVIRQLEDQLQVHESEISVHSEAKTRITAALEVLNGKPRRKYNRSPSVAKDATETANPEKNVAKGKSGKKYAAMLTREDITGIVTKFLRRGIKTAQEIREHVYKKAATAKTGRSGLYQRIEAVLKDDGFKKTRSGFKLLTVGE